MIEIAYMKLHDLHIDKPYSSIELNRKSQVIEVAQHAYARIAKTAAATAATASIEVCETRSRD
jgi:hypothetical protein